MSEKATSVRQAKKTPEKVIYLGPTIADGSLVLKKNSIYSNGLPPDVAERVKNDADLAKFFFPVGKRAITGMNKLADAESDLSVLSNNLKNNYLSKRKKAG